LERTAWGKLVWDYSRGTVIDVETGEVVDQIYSYGPPQGGHGEEEEGGPRWGVISSARGGSKQFSGLFNAAVEEAERASLPRDAVQVILVLVRECLRRGMRPRPETIVAAAAEILGVDGAWCSRECRKIAALYKRRHI